MYIQTVSRSAHVTANAALSYLQTAAAHFEGEEAHWPAWKVALFFAVLSGLSLPLGALLGIWTTPTDTGDEQSEEREKADLRRREIVAYCLAFGAGALLFAVTVELYGEAMRELEEDGYRNGSLEVLVMVACAMLGALIYTYLNRWLENFLREEDEEEELPAVSETSPLVRSASSVRGPSVSARPRRLSVVDGLLPNAPGQKKSHVRGRSVASFMLLDQLRSGPDTGSSVSASRHAFSPRDTRSLHPQPVVECCGSDRKASGTTRKGTPAQTSTEALDAPPPVGRTTTTTPLDTVRESANAPAAAAASDSDCESSSGRSEMFDGHHKSDFSSHSPRIPKDSPRPKGHKSPLLVGMATWLGVFIDGVPEGVLLGFLAAEHRLSMALVVSLFIANFPEAFSSACLLREAKKPAWAILGLWSTLLVLTAGLAGLAALAYPTGGEVPLHWRLAVAAVEGIAGGAMLACIAAVMLPEAYHLQGDAVGVVVVAGFITSVLVKLFGGVASERTVDMSRSQHGSHHLFLAAWD